MSARPYELKATREIAKAPGVWVRELTFAPGEATPWHAHSQMTDRCYGLAGELTLEIRDHPATPLAPGAIGEVPVGAVHRLVNRSVADARMLLVQSGGRYDFLRAE